MDFRKTVLRCSAVFFLTLFVSGCPNDSERCVQNNIVVCSCLDGTLSTKLCIDGKNYTDCGCKPAQSTADTSGGAGTAGIPMGAAGTGSASNP
jgi:hypothetical protein